MIEALLDDHNIEKLRAESKCIIVKFAIAIEDNIYSITIIEASISTLVPLDLTEMI
ncbi:hypothetical protein SYJ56_19345 [Algoriphagus sp. D3-2-R+10]|uniref:hypothetical protein n=1 Tax=Algoriphagus aurantiacus TaxID=3103948 RepID=UPI002B37BED9|nr:hypothetical protein [Algoriphagus sp. D3-2-R+10]MEB2777479.1 hypothetical protein [Algoriphagus sp. D3-2-R+10]